MTRVSTDHVVRALALFAAVQSTFSGVHGFCDHILQNGEDACAKGRPGWPGRRACARHVATYSAAQLGAVIGVTRVLGYRLPPSSLLAGILINAGTHYAIDRRGPLKRLLGSRWLNKIGYLEHCTVRRGNGAIDDSGPGTALMECDQAIHHLIGVAASLIVTWLAERPRNKD